MHSEQPLYYLSAHIHCCVLSDGAVFLDTRNGNYLGIDSRYLSVLTTHLADWPTASTLHRAHPINNFKQGEQLIVDLRERGIITTTMSKRPVVEFKTPMASWSATGRGTLRSAIPMQHRVIFILSLLRVLLMRRKDRLEPIINWLRRRQTAVDRVGSIDTERITRLLHSFERTRLWFYTAKQQCLLDSLVLSAYLSHAGQPCSFVIAVSTKPFLAHAWVQIENAVLNDTAEHAQLFSPLLVVG